MIGYLTLPGTTLETMPVTGLVDLYRHDYTPAATVLLERFRPYLLKWVRLLLFGKWDHKDKEIRHFLQMMGQSDVEKTAQILSIRLKAYESVDIEQEIRVAFLEVALRTQSIRTNFKYTLQKRVVRLLRDPLVYNYDRNVQVSEAVDYHQDTRQIDELWVAGFTCGIGFDELSPTERRIIQLHYYNGLTIEGTARQLGIGTATVSRTISKVKRILSFYYTTH